MSLQFGILGTLTATVDGQPIDLGPPKQRALLALLVIHPNRVIATDRILDLLWGDDATGKEKALWVYISRLRTVLEPDRTQRGESSYLLTEGNGYVLRIDPTGIDAVEFEREVAEARALARTDPTATSEILARALQRWRGDALQDFTYDDFARAEIVRLEELRLDAVEERIEADLQRGRSRELIGELETLREAHPLRERPVGQLTRALYRSGRHADALRAIERFRRHLGTELGIEPSAELRRLEEQVLLQDPRLDAKDRGSASQGGGTLVDTPNPFKGLRPFGEDDASSFFGRERLVADVVHRLSSGTRLLALVGPSGSGKSSAVKAGVIPALRKGGPGGDERWMVAQMVPGSHPFAELEVALLRSSLDTPISLREQLDAPDTGLLRAALRVLPDSDTRLLLVIDQFEELFMLVEDDEQQHRFLTQLLTAIGDPHGRISVLVTLRSDLYGAPLAHPAFGARLGDGIINVVPLLPNELESAASLPATQAGVAFEPALLTTLIADVAGAPGALPLFQFTLAELFDRRIGDTLILDTYREMGGLAGAITRRAEDLYDALTGSEQAAAKQLFLRLVTLADGGQLGRRRVPASEITMLGVDAVALQTVIDRYTRNRLLTTDRDHVSGSPTIEVAHEALLSEWDRLRVWIDDAGDDIRRHASLKLAMDEWLEADRSADFLLGSRLGMYDEWAAVSTIQLTEAEREYLDASVQARDALASADADRRATEQKLATSARRRLWALAVAVAILATAAGLYAAQVTGPDPARVALLMPNLPDEQEGLARTGTERAQRDLGVDVEELTGRFTDIEATYRDLAEGGVDLIFLDNASSGWQWVEEVIADYPDTDFAVINGVLAPAGAGAVYFADEEAGYLAGMAAALATETGVVGFVGNYHSDTSERWRAGFEAGAAAAGPEVEVLAIYTGAGSGSFSDPAAGAEAADELFARDADVVLAFAGDATTGVIEAARAQFEENGTHRWVIGSESDWSIGVAADLRPHVLVSAIRQWDVAVYDTIRSHVDGEFAPGITSLGLDAGAVGLSRSEYLSAGELAAIADLSADVVDGGVQIPRAPAGALLAPPGVTETATVTLTWDGERCTYDDGGADLPNGTHVRVDLVNDSPEYWYFFIFHSERGIPMSTLVQPHGNSSGYLTLVPGTIDFRCGPEIRDRPRAEVAAHTTTAHTVRVAP